MIPVQLAAQRLNRRHSSLSTEDLNDKYSMANIATIVIGGLLLILILTGTFFMK